MKRLNDGKRVRIRKKDLSQISKLASDAGMELRIHQKLEKHIFIIKQQTT